MMLNSRIDPMIGRIFGQVMKASFMGGTLVWLLWFPVNGDY